MRILKLHFQLLLVCATAFALPGPLPLSSNASVKLDTLSKGHRPPDPPGFETRIWHPNPSPGNRLNPLVVYMTAITYLHEHTSAIWAQPAKASIFRQPGTNLAITVRPSKDAGHGIPELSNGCIMLALYAGVVSMSEGHLFYTTRIDVNLSGKPVGAVWILKTEATETSGSASNMTLQGPTSDVLDKIIGTSRIDVPDRGRYADPLVPGLEMEYTFSEREVDSADVYTIIMEAFMILCYDGDEQPFEYLNAVSASGNVALNIHHTNSMRPTQSTMSAFLFMLMLFFSGKQRWDELDFVMWVRVDHIPRFRWAEGFFLRMSNGNETAGGDTTAA